MPPLEQMDMHDTAIMWEFVRTDRKGMPIVSSPEEIRCRWEEGQFELKDSEGQQLVLDVIMTTTQDIPLGSLLWEGTETQLRTLVGNSLTPTSGIFECVIRGIARDLKGRVNRHEFGLKRFKDKFPSVV